MISLFRRIHHLHGLNTELTLGSLRLTKSFFVESFINDELTAHYDADSMADVPMSGCDSLRYPKISLGYF